MPTPCWLKHLGSIRALVSVSVFLFLSLSLRLFLWSAEALWVHFPARASKTLLRRRSAPSPIKRAPEASMNRASPVPGALLAFCVNQGISASFSPLLSYHQLQTTRLQSIKGPQQVNFLWLWFSVCLPSDGEGKRLMEASWWERLTEGKAEILLCQQRSV